jgi:hypothetical protein
VWWSYVESPAAGWLQQYVKIWLVYDSGSWFWFSPEFPFVIVAVCFQLLLGLAFAHDEKRCLRFLHIFLVSLLGSAVIACMAEVVFFVMAALAGFGKNFRRVIRKCVVQAGFGFFYLADVIRFLNPAVLLSALTFCACCDMASFL